MYYRIFILFPNSKYMFTKSRRAVLEPVEPPIVLTEKPIIKPVEKPIEKEKPKPVALPPQKQTAPVTNVAKAPVEKPAEPEEKYLILPKIDNSRIYYMMETPNLKKPSVNNPGKIKATTIEVQKIIYVKRRDTVIMILPGSRVSRFSDSLVRETKDTMYFVNADTIQIKPYVEVYKELKEVYKVSPNVFAAKDGNVLINLTDYNKKKYSISFFEGDSTLVLEVKDVKDSTLTIDKTNFGHAGWFRFELYEDGKLKEKNKFLIPKE